MEFTQSLQQRHPGPWTLAAVNRATTFFLPSRPTVSAAHRDCESTIAAVGVRL